MICMVLGRGHVSYTVTGVSSKGPGLKVAGEQVGMSVW